jgi:hypothetical protein
MQLEAEEKIGQRLRAEAAAEEARRAAASAGLRAVGSEEG